MASLPVTTTDTVNVIKIGNPEERNKLMWEGLNEQRKEGRFCDIIIKCKESVFHAHKCVLASISSYFEVMFTSPLASENQHVANLHEFSEKSIEIVLDIMYNQTVKEAVYIMETLKLAEFLQYDCLVTMLVKAIRVIIDDTNVFHWYDISRDCGIKQLTVLTECYVRKKSQKLLGMDEYKNRQCLINDILTISDNFDEEVVLYKSNKDQSVYLIDVEKNTNVDKYISGPCEITCWEYISIFTFFMHKNDFFVVYSYDSVSINISDYQPCSQKFEPVDTFSWKSRLSASIHSRYLTIDQVVYDKLDGLYVLFSSQESVVIFKYDLTERKFFDNYIWVDYEMNVILPCKELGTLLVQGLEKVFDLSKFNFNLTSGKRKVETLGISPIIESKVHKSINRALKAEDGILDGTWDAVSLNGEVYFIIVSDHNEKKLSVLKLDFDELVWIHLYDFPSITGDLISTFCCQEKLFFVISTVVYKDACKCFQEICTFQTLPGRKPLRHYTQGYVYDYANLFDPAKMTLTDTGMRFKPSKNIWFKPFTIPAHVLL